MGDLDDSFGLENLADDILIEENAPTHLPDDILENAPTHLPDDILDLVQENAPTHENLPSRSDQEPASKRFKRVSDNDINHLMAQNSEKSTERQTKWAVKLLKGR